MQEQNYWWLGVLNAEGWSGLRRGPVTGQRSNQLNLVSTLFVTFMETCVFNGILQVQSFRLASPF
jgi:hypothetical protein